MNNFHSNAAFQCFKTERKCGVLQGLFQITQYHKLYSRETYIEMPKPIVKNEHNNDQKHFMKTSTPLSAPLSAPLFRGNKKKNL